MDEKTIDVAFSVYKHEREGLFQASDELKEAKSDLENKKIKVFTEGKIDGSNDITRKAQYAELTTREQSNIEVKERDYALAQLAYDLASYEVRRVELLVQFISISKGE